MLCSFHCFLLLGKYIHPTHKQTQETLVSPLVYFHSFKIVFQTRISAFILVNLCICPTPVLLIYVHVPIQVQAQGLLQCPHGTSFIFAKIIIAATVVPEVFLRRLGIIDPLGQKVSC